MARQRCREAGAPLRTPLFLNVLILGVLVTAFLSLDLTILVLTPIVFEVAVRRRVDAVSYLFA